MLEDTELIGTLTAGLVAAFAGGFIARRLGMPPIVGYLLAGVVVGPFTPGYAADTELAQQIAEIGVILLLFGVGIHFSVRDLLSVRAVAGPGAAAQIAGATVITTAVAMLWGWSFGEGLVLGLSISVASTVVLLRALEDRRALTSTEGRIAVGWLIVEDLFTVLVLVLLPVLATTLGGEVPEDYGGDVGGGVFVELVVALAKLAALGALIFLVAARAVPWLLAQVAREGSRELFTLAVLAGALGIAFGSALLFDVSLALGAFLAGLLVGQSSLSHQAAADALPLRDAFAVLFFVSVGMLFDPEIIVEEPARLAAIVGIVIVGKSAIALGIVLWLGHPLRVALVVAAALSQVGEFSFILSEVGSDFGLLSDDGVNLILAAAIISIGVNPLVFAGVAPAERWLQARMPLVEPAPVADDEAGAPTRRHGVVVGYGDIGKAVASVLSERFEVLVVERNPRVAETIGSGMRVVLGDAAHPFVIEHMGIELCVVMIITIPDPFATRLLVERAREARPNLNIIARALNEDEAEHLRQLGVGETIVAEQEVALEMIRHALQRFGVDLRQALAIVQRLRRS